MTFGRVAEALPRAIRLVGWPKLVIFFFLFFFFWVVSELEDTSILPATSFLAGHLRRGFGGLSKTHAVDDEEMR